MKSALKSFRSFFSPVQMSSMLVKSTLFQDGKSKISPILSNHYHHHNNRQSQPKYMLASTGFISSLMVALGFEDELTKESPLITTIRQAMYCQKCKDYDKAELIYHAALNMAKEESNRKGETYIFACLGNNAFLKEDYEKSTIVYKDVIRRLLEDGEDENSEAIVEISLKIATGFSKTGKIEKAEIGFQHCIRVQQERLENVDQSKPLDPVKDAKVINSMALYGMALDWYAKHNLRHYDYQHALEYSLKALDVCEKVNGKNGAQTLVLLSDIGCIYNLLENYDDSIAYLEKAATVARTTDSSEKKIILYNLGMAYLMKNKWNESYRNCSASFSLAKNESNESLMEASADCMRKAKNQSVTG